MILWLEYLILFFLSKLIILNEVISLIHDVLSLVMDTQDVVNSSIFFTIKFNEMIFIWWQLSSFIVNFINSSSEHCFSNCLFNSKLIHIRNIYIYFFQNWMILKLFLQRFFETSLKLEIMWCKIFIKLPTSICDNLKVQKEKWQLLTLICHFSYLNLCDF